MKPRLWFYKGLWHCRGTSMECIFMIKTGLGFTPLEAYRDWEAM